VSTSSEAGLLIFHAIVSCTWHDHSRRASKHSVTRAATCRRRREFRRRQRQYIHSDRVGKERTTRENEHRRCSTNIPMLVYPSSFIHFPCLTPIQLSLKFPSRPLNRPASQLHSYRRPQRHCCWVLLQSPAFHARLHLVHRHRQPRSQVVELLAHGLPVSGHLVGGRDLIQFKKH